MAQKPMIDVVHVFDNGLVHVEVVAEAVRTVSGAARAAIDRIAAGDLAGALEAHASVEAGKMYVEVAGTGVRVNFVLKLSAADIHLLKTEVYPAEPEDHLRS